MPDDEEKRLRQLAALADVETENPDEADIPWAAGINPFKKDDDDAGMTPEEFLKTSKDNKDLPKFTMIKVGGSAYKASGLKVKIPAINEKGYEIVPMNKYTDPLNEHPFHRGGKHKEYPMWEKMAEASTERGNPISDTAVGYGADLRGFARSLIDPHKKYPHKDTEDIEQDLKRVEEFYEKDKKRIKPLSSYTKEELDQAEQVFSARYGGLQMKGKRPLAISAP